mmetsp:Transcript_17021/g.50801  ORF Transcript_17021/g.50801 Transcript_17021/m.50801 type:complete len:486 (+) Transcript_17021:287-1744(+)
MGGVPMDIDADRNGGASLTSAPPDDLSGSPQIQRATADYVMDSRFRVKDKSYGQYAQSYFVRLALMRPILKARAQRDFPGLPVEGILNLPEAKECVVIGTAYKEMKLKPNILDEYVKERGVSTVADSGKLTSADDVMILEDEKARMVLRSTDDLIGRVTTGVALIVKGSAVPGGDFVVSDYRFAGLPPPMKGIDAPAPAPPQPAALSNGAAAQNGSGTCGNGRKFVALVSGLGIGGEAGDPLGLSLLVDWLTGVAGSPQDQALAAQVVRVVIAGNVLHRAAVDALAAPTTHSSFRAANHVLQPVKEMDMALTELASGVPVDVMPGASDPASAALPQQPLHRCLFPAAAAYSTFCCVTNPHCFSADGITFLGTSGQNVDDVCRYSNVVDPVEILGSMLEWQHLVPTAPDTLVALPQSDGDPFLIPAAPSVLFAGNQPAYGTSLKQGPGGQKVRIIALPEFRKTGTAVLVDLATLEPQLLQFDAALN